MAPPVDWKLAAGPDQYKWRVANVSTPDRQTGVRFYPEERRGSNIVEYVREGTLLHTVGSSRVGDFVYVKVDENIEGWLKRMYVDPVETAGSVGGATGSIGKVDPEPAVEIREQHGLSCSAEWVDGSGQVNLRVSGSNVSVSRNEQEVWTAAAPYHAYMHMKGILPTFDTHESSLASACLAESLKQCDLVALVISDEGSYKWNEALTDALSQMGARNVPPAFRASWVFLWTPEKCFEAYNSRGAAELKANVRGRQFHLQSAGWWHGRFASISIDGARQLPETTGNVLFRGITAYMLGPKQSSILDMRRFETEQLFTNYLSQVQPGSRCLAVCCADRDENTMRYPKRFYEMLMRLGGSGLAIGRCDAFLLSGMMQSWLGPMREKPIIKSVFRENDAPLYSGKHAIVSILFGAMPAICLGALVLAKSLSKHSPEIPKVLLVSSDVPEHHKPILVQAGWQVKEVQPLHGAFTNFHEDAKFASAIFMKLYIFNSDVLPYEKVLFLDLDTIVRQDIGHVFEFQTPSAVCNWKCAEDLDCPEHGEVIDAARTSINAGVILCSPNKLLFDLLKFDAERAGSHHCAAWAPEQVYLSNMLSGYWRHLHCRYNFEPQIHGGTCTSQDWAQCEVDRVCIAHFSGLKPWDLSANDEIACVANTHFDCNRKKYRMLESHYHRRLASRRCRVFHEEWFQLFFEIDFLQDSTLDGHYDAASQGVIPASRMEAYLKRCACVEQKSDSGKG